MTAPHSEESAPADCQYQFILDLDARQDALMLQLDELNRQIESVLDQITSDNSDSAAAA